MAEQFQKVHDPFQGDQQQVNFGDMFGTNNAVGQLSSEQDFFSQMTGSAPGNQTNQSQKNKNNDMTDFFDTINQSTGAQNNSNQQMQIIQRVDNTQGSSNPLNAGLFNEDDILMTLGTGSKQKQSQPLNSQSSNAASGFDQIFQATAHNSGGQGFSGMSSSSQIQGQGYQSRTAPMKTGSYGSNQNQKKTDDALKGRNLGTEAISSDRKKTLFQRYIFDSYKYQIYFNTSTTEITGKLINALWPFYPQDQPDELVIDYKLFCRTLFGDQNIYQGVETDDAQTREDSAVGGAFFAGHDVESGVHNPFNKDNNTLSFLGRDLEKEDKVAASQLKVNQYKKNEQELYGPIWIFITLVVEFIILGHWSTLMSTQANTKSEEIMNMLMQKNRSATLQRIMKIIFFFGCFYFGLPFVAYLQFKGAQAMEISYATLLINFGYAFIPFIPGSIFIFCFQTYGRVKYFSILTLWVLLLFNIYKTTYESRRKYFDFATNKQMAWYLTGITFFYIMLYKSYFLQV